MSQFRKFELFYSGLSGSLSVRNLKDAVNICINNEDEYIDVIEYAALEAAQKEIKQLKIKNEHLEAIIHRLTSGNKNMIEASFETEIEQLKKDNTIILETIKGQHRLNDKLSAALKVAEDALKRYSERTVWFKDGGKLIYKSGSTTPFFKDEEWCESDCADEALAEIQKIKKGLG